MNNATVHGRLFSLIATAVLMLTPAARAQYMGGTPSGGITGMGTAAIERAPDRMRMQVELSASGKDIKEAVAALKKQEASAKQALSKLGADPASIKLGDPRVASSNNNNSRMQQQMEQMIRIRTGKAAPPAATQPAKQTVRVSATLTAEWALSAKTNEDLLVETTELQAKIKEAKVTGAEGQKGPSPEEMEEMEEMAGAYMEMSGANMMPGEPFFLYVTKLTKEDRTKAAADAYKKAQEQAAQLAAASGSELGALRLIGSTEGNAAMNDYYNEYGYDSPAGRVVYRAMQNQLTGGAGEPEAIGAQPGKVSYRVMVYVAFDIKGK